MSKKKIYYDEVKRLYVFEQMTIEEIASRLKLGVRTIKYWKKDQGWDVERKKYLESRQTSSKESYFCARQLLWSLNEDFKDERKISSSRMHSLANLIDSVLKLGRQEKELNELKKNLGLHEKRNFLTPEEVKNIQREFWGWE